jgi:cytochrome P450
MFERNSSRAFDQHMLSPEFYANPYPIYHQLRDADPVHWSDAWKGWVLTRYADVTSTLRDFSRFSNVGRIDLFLEQLPEEGRGKMGPLKGHFSRAITHLDPPDHTRIRKLLKTVLSTRLVQSMCPRIEALVSELISEVQDAGRMDVIRDFAYPLPAIVLGEMLGIPPEDRDQYKKWSDDIGVGLVGTGRAALDNVERARQSLFELTDYLRPLVAQRRQHPRNDLISNLIAIEVKGDRLSERELFSTCITLILAGHGTTTNLIGNGILALLRHPDQLEALKNDPSLIEIAVEELLRYDSPLQRIWRMATEDVEIDGKHIRKGQIVLPTMGAANRDPAEFAEPDRLNISRQNNPHVALGTGIHLCVGGPLARLQGVIAINALLQRLPSLQLETEALAWEANLFHRGLKSLPVVF